MIKEGIQKLITMQNLSQNEMENIFREIMQGEATPAQIAAFITLLRVKGETIDEITGAAKIMRQFAAAIKADKDIILDTCGTGGDNKHTFNISTFSALVASGAGITVAKHGNRGVSSKCGSADLLEALGVNVCADISVAEKCLNSIGIGFLFAPNVHKAMKYAAGPRKEIGIKTIFNILGPLTNPANATNQLLGVFDAKLTEPIAHVLKNLGTKHAIVVHGKDGLDEISTTSETLISELKNGEIKNYVIAPEDFAIKRVSMEKLQVNSIEDCLKTAWEILNAQEGPVKEAVLINSAFAIYAADYAGSIEQALELAKISLNTGKAKQKLEELIKYTNENNIR